MLPAGAEIGYEVAAENAIYMIENDVFGGSGWPKALRHTLAYSPHQVSGAVAAAGEEAERDGLLIQGWKDIWRMLTMTELEYGRQLLQQWLDVLVALYQHASDSENTEAMLQLGHLLYYGAQLCCKVKCSIGTVSTLAIILC